VRGVIPTFPCPSSTGLVAVLLGQGFFHGAFTLHSWSSSRAHGTVSPSPSGEKRVRRDACWTNPSRVSSRVGVPVAHLGPKRRLGDEGLVEPFQSDRRCSMCGSSAISTQFHRPGTARCHLPKCHISHMHRVCIDCRYEWGEDVPEREQAS
jgi:hypothetical protein